jgi:UDP-2-acetamido-2-deoxy-ribo-hexuluronate aminotransferase
VPAHLQPAFRSLGYVAGEFPLAEKASDRVLSLPMHPYLTIEDQNKICDSLKHAISGALHS